MSFLKLSESITKAQKKGDHALVNQFEAEYASSKSKLDAGMDIIAERGRIQREADAAESLRQTEILIQPFLKKE